MLNVIIAFLHAVVIAVGSRTLSKAQSFIEETSSSSAKAYGSYEEVISDSNVHGVYIPLPTSLHLEWVKKAAEKGKHILLEKPIALVSFACLKRVSVALPGVHMMLLHFGCLDACLICAMHCHLECRLQR